MTGREKLIALIRECNKFHEEAKEKWILAGKQGERPSLIASLADHLLANGVVVREKGEWVVCGDGDNVPWMCSHCGKTTAHKYKVMYGNFCPNCGADMRKGENG